MPEGDSIRRVADRLQPLVGERVSAESPHPRGLATGVAAAVDGRVLERVHAVGKHLLLGFEGGVTVRSHLRMSGRWRVQPVDEPLLGRPWLVLSGARLRAAQWHGPVLTLEARAVRRLGPDLLSPGFDPVAAAARVRAAAGATLAEALLDQTLVAGIGNMWMCEALWRARVSPARAASAAERGAVEHALAWLASEMAQSVAGVRHRREVYRRGGRPCRRCGAPIVARGLGDANRTAYFCPGCQV